MTVFIVNTHIYNPICILLAAVLLLYFLFDFLSDEILFFILKLLVLSLHAAQTRVFVLPLPSVF